MRLIFSTEEFVYAGRARPGFPIILGGDMRPLQPFHDFLIWKLLGAGKTLSNITWEDYGRRLWDYAMFLGANSIPWDQRSTAPGLSGFARYRDWSLFDVEVSPKTYNGRRRLIEEFYNWAFTNNRISQLPFDHHEVSVPKVDRALMHVDTGERTRKSSGFEAREWEKAPEFLTIDQLAAIHALPLSASHTLLFKLMVRVGLRSCEARSFPLSNVFNPALRADCHPDRMIRLWLKPGDMHIKFGKPREVDVPYSLMQELHSYTLYERNRLASHAPKPESALILTVGGRPFSKDDVVQLMQRIRKRVGFKTTALILRHSYAVHTLRKLRDSKDFKGDPLLYVRDRLGHEDVQTTITYLRQIERLAGALVLAMEDEFDRLFEM